MDREAAARDYLARGWTPVPVRRGSKKPHDEGWQRRRLTADDIPRLFSGNGNIGLLTGSLSGGLTDVDLDCDEAVALSDHFLPPTPMRSGHTTRPTSHRWYVALDGVPASRAFTDVDKDKTMLVELRTDGHQTLVPPSIHPNGDLYIWDGDHAPTPLPGIELTESVGRLTAATLLVRHWPRERGGRHQIANALAGMLVRAGWSEEETAGFIEAVAPAAGDEESRSRARAAIATARKHAGGGRTTGTTTLIDLLGEPVVHKVREWLGLASPDAAAVGMPPWTPPATFRRVTVPEFPTACLPDWLRAFVEELSVATQTPAALAGGLVLATVALTIARRVRVEVHPGWIEPVNLFTATSMAPGNRKSAVFAAVNAPIVEFERREAIRLAPEIRKAEGRRRVLAKALKDAEKAAAKAELEGSGEGGDDIERLQAELANVVVPIRPRYFTDDVTPEALSRLIDRHGGRFAVLSAEGGVFELMAGRYGNNGAPNFDVYLKGHAGDPLRVDRVQRENEIVDLPALTIGLAFQPDVLKGLATKPGFRGRGLLGRFLYSLPASLVGRREIGAPAVSESTRIRFEHNIIRLLQDTPEPASPFGSPRICLGDQALEVFATFERWIEPQLAVDAQLGTLADWASKLAGAVARMGAVLHVATLVDARTAAQTPISPNTIENAIALGHFYLAHASAAFAEMGADPEVERASRLLDWLRRKGLISFTVRDAFQDLKGRFQKVSELRPPLQLLVDHGYVRPAAPDLRPGPGRPPSERFEVNPLWNRNSEDIEDIEEASQDLNLNHLSSKDASSGAPPDSKSLSDLPPQNPQNPQNSDSEHESRPDDEVAL